MSPEKILKVVKRHEAWLLGRAEGERAVLRQIDARGLSLSMMLWTAPATGI